MKTPGELAFVVHVAGTPITVFPEGDRPALATQRCVACGFLLIDNSAWLSGAAAVVEDDQRGMSWFPAGALIGTDKRDNRAGGMSYVRETGRPLDDNERACT